MATLFSHLLVLVTLGTGLVWAFDRYVLLPKRQQKLALAEQSAPVDAPAREAMLREGVIAENCRSVFPVLAAVLVLRSFLYEPFQIPSGSMMPTLLVGDFILVEKYTYGIKDPVWRHKLVETGTPERGDIAVFKYPRDTRVDYIKRIVALPGDKVVYRNKRLYVQPACDAGMDPCPRLEEVARSAVSSGDFVQNGVPLQRFNETLGEANHDFLINPARPEPRRYYYPQSGQRTGEWVVPEGKYFAMGDNRDNSTDSRFWGFVDDEHLVGKAVFIWVSFEFERGADSFLPSWIPTGVRFSRTGGLE